MIAASSSSSWAADMKIVLPYIPGQRDMNLVIYVLMLAILERIFG